MLLVLLARRPEVLETMNRDMLCETYFHPGYLIKRGVEAFKDMEFNIPQAKFGAPDIPDDDIIVIDEDGNDGEHRPVSGPTRLPMLPPWKYTLEQYKRNVRRGRPRTRRIRSRGEVGGTGAPASSRSSSSSSSSSASTARSRAFDFDFSGF